VVWSKHGCVATFTKQGDPLAYSNSCTNSQTYRSDEIATRHRARRRNSDSPADASLVKTPGSSAAP
jgi:hypothetical protein